MKEHYNCHICESKDGKKEFMESMREMVKHFRKDHYLCEHPDCKENPLTAVFSDEVNFQIHVSKKHGGIDKKDIRMDIGLSRNAVDMQQEIEEQIQEQQNQTAPDMENEEEFPTMGGKKKNGFTFHAAKTGLPQSNSSMSSRISQGTNRNVAHQNYRSLGNNKNISDAEEFPTLGGGNVRAPINPNWKAKAVQNNKPITRPNVISSSKSKSKSTPAPKVTIPVQNSATAALYAASQGQSWSQEPDVFVEKSQLQLEAERNARLAEERATQSKKAAPQRDHSQFPSLGGGAAKPNAFWGVPGASIPKSNTGKKKGKQKVLPRPDILPGQAPLPVSHKPSPAKSKAPTQTPPPPQAQHFTKNQKRVESDVTRGEANSASDLAARFGGGYSGWSAPPETFQEKSLLEIEDERRRTHAPKVKNQRAPKLEEFPTLGGSKAAAPAGFWGVPGAATKKAPGSGKGKNAKKQPVPMPAKKAVIQQPAKKPTKETVQNQTPKTKKAVIYAAPEPVPETQNASQLAQRMTGGYSGWSAPPTVFVEKSLLEIQDEERRKKQSAQQNGGPNWSPKDDSAFPSLGGDFTAAVPTVSGFASMLSKEPTKKEQKKAAKKEVERKVEPEFVVSDEQEFPAFENNQQICDESSEEESDSEVDMAAVNQRLRDAIAQMSAKLQDRFKICSGKFRTGQITADDYVKEGSSIMGKKAFVKLIPDLLATLPDGKHKNALAAAYKKL